MRETVSYSEAFKRGVVEKAARGCCGASLRAPGTRGSRYSRSKPRLCGSRRAMLLGNRMPPEEAEKAAQSENELAFLELASAGRVYSRKEAEGIESAVRRNLGKAEAALDKAAQDIRETREFLAYYDDEFEEFLQSVTDSGMITFGDIARQYAPEADPVETLINRAADMLDANTEERDAAVAELKELAGLYPSETNKYLAPNGEPTELILALGKKAALTAHAR
ncbi:MAG: hypothetical protein Pg6C_08120 [Treponemataceae bacterium]|nr:MAG: hypothetical protein Pg6C_08120 [Treponemataceae bacterium]